ncbi:MAG: glycosyltransferase family 2 protein [Thermodesulfobacteriota bacterium]
MSENKRPKLSIGLPVYNGEDFLEEAIESILSQTYTDFELIISDNASVDRTEEICLDYAAKDDRIRYIRQSENLGAARNFNSVFELSSGEYFKWAAHDDVCKGNFLSRCIEALDQEHSACLGYTRAITIDEKGKFKKKHSPSENFGSEITHLRFREALSDWGFPVPLFGVIRSNILSKTTLFTGYASCDRPLLAELSLYGRFYEVPEYLFLERSHPDNGRRFYNDPDQSAIWWGVPLNKKTVYQHWKLLSGFVTAVNRVPLSWHERAHCYIEVSNWIKRHQLYLFQEILKSIEVVPVLGKFINTSLIKFYLTSRLNPMYKVIKDIDSVIPIEDKYILVDQCSFRKEYFPGKRHIPFLEKDGQYWGLPGDDETAIIELERIRLNGANFIAFTRPAFWWLDYYKKFSNYLRLNFQCLIENNRLVIFDLRIGKESS